MNLYTLLTTLLTQPSISPNDAGCMDILADYLSQHGFSIETKTFGKVKNFWAIHGNQAPLTVFAGHTDVVPTGDEAEWISPPFKPTEKDGYLYARGAADMKSGVATMCVAAVEFIKANPDYKGSIAIMLTSDEEGEAKDGLRKFVPYLIDKGVQMDYAVFAEPSSVNQLGDMIKNGRRGSLHAHITIIGKQGHIAYPDKAANPIHALGDIISELTNEQWCRGNKYFQPTSLQIWEIDGGTGANNVIPATVQLNCNLRFSSELTSKTISERIENIVKKQINQYNAKTGKDFSYQIVFDISGEPFITPEGDLVNAMRDACTDVLGVTPVLSTSGGTSDARFVAPYGVQVVEFGPVNKTIHQVNECIKIADIEPLKNAYLRLLEKLYI